MKKVVLCLLLGALLGAIGWNYYHRPGKSPVARRAGDLTVETGGKAAGTKEAVVEKVRGLGNEIDDGRIEATIKAKLFMDRELSALAVSVECTEGKVVLSGSVESPALIARAVELTRKTAGVRTVTPKLRVKN